jgi:hypothetical protein
VLIPEHADQQTQPLHDRQRRVHPLQLLQRTPLELHGKARIDLVLAREVLVDRALPDFRSVGNLLHRDGLPGLRGKQVERRVEDLAFATSEFAFLAFGNTHGDSVV